MACSTNCPTQDHKSWGECVRAKGIETMRLESTRPSLGAQRRFDQQTDELRQVVKAGGSIATAQNKGYDAAYKEAEEKEKRRADVAA